MIRHIPLIGELPNSNGSSIKAALKETIYSTMFSTAPIWFFPIFSAFFFTSESTLAQNMYSSVEQGDLYIYASSLVGPLLFAITANYAEWDAKDSSPNASKLGRLTISFPYGSWFFIISILICTLAGMCFGFMRFTSLGEISAKLNRDNLFTFSVWMYLFSIFCLFCVSVYRNELSNGKFASDDTRNFVNDWRNRNG